ncbi:hypothetical protein B0H16DRAFT_1452814 [Mycena metata]|uniref:Uncharacterized protein n=1 Tax=Mycena metata TaxID=1033252 RepID=A0AAD7JNY5_9AGAR|nr:hypothetical protein B0H16DRAFT_1452814 [Mycena metata]
MIVPVQHLGNAVAVHYRPYIFKGLKLPPHHPPPKVLLMRRHCRAIARHFSKRLADSSSLCPLTRQLSIQSSTNKDRPGLDSSTWYKCEVVVPFWVSGIISVQVSHHGCPLRKGVVPDFKQSSVLGLPMHSGELRKMPATVTFPGNRCQTIPESWFQAISIQQLDIGHHNHREDSGAAAVNSNVDRATTHMVEVHGSLGGLSLIGVTEKVKNHNRQTSGLNNSNRIVPVELARGRAALARQ